MRIIGKHVGFAHSSVRFSPRAFTLIELLVVLGIIGVLLALTFPAIGSVKTGAKSSGASAAVHEIVTAVSAFDVEYGRLPRLDGEGLVEAGEDIAVGDPRAGMKFQSRPL